MLCEASDYITEMDISLLQEEYANIPVPLDVEPGEVYGVLAESAMSYNTLLKVCGLDDSSYRYFREAEEAKDDSKKSEEKKGIIRRFIDGVIKLIKTIWSKIVGVWKWIVAKFDQYLRWNKSFVSKYEEKLKNVISVKYEGYEFNIFDVANAVDTSKLTENIIDAEKAEQAKTTIAKALSNGKINSYTEFTPENLRKLFQGEKKERDYNIKQQLDYIRHLDDDRKKLSKGIIVLKEYTDGFVKGTQDAFKDLGASHEEAKIAGKCAKECMEMLLTYTSMGSKAYAERASQARAICLKALKEYEEKENKSESQKESAINPLLREAFYNVKF